MKILLITTTYPTPARPKQGAFNRVLVESLSARHDVRVIAPIPWVQSLRTRLQASECIGVQHPIYWYPPKFLRRTYDRFYWQSIRASIHQLERDFRPDVILGYWLHPDGAAAVRAGQHFGVPAIVMSGGSDLRLLTSDPRRRRAIAEVVNGAERLVVFSRDLATCAASLGISNKKIDTVYRGVDHGCFHPMDRSLARRQCGIPDDAKVVFWAGRMEPVKNPLMLLDAAVEWKRIFGTRLHFILAGDGPMRRQLQRRCSALNLEQVVHFAGNLSHRDLAWRYNAADVTVLTSHSEGTPNVLLESIACGTPFVATNVGGVPEIATPPIDHLVSAGDLRAFTEAVLHVMATPCQTARGFVPCNLPGMAEQVEAAMARCPSLKPILDNSPETPGLPLATPSFNLPSMFAPAQSGEG